VVFSNPVEESERMPAVDTVLLPLCVGLSLLGVIATGSPGDAQ
jgi:hypothetical protein